MSTTEQQPFLVLPTQASDAEAVIACNNRAFGAGSFRDWIFPDRLAHLTPPAELAQWRANRMRKQLEKGVLLHYKCVPADDHSKVIGYTAWNRPGHFEEGKSLTQSWGLDGKKEGKDEAKSAPKEDAEAFPAALDVEAQRYAMTTIDEQRKKIWGDGGNYWCK